MSKNNSEDHSHNFSSDDLKKIVREELVVRQKEIGMAIREYDLKKAFEAKLTPNGVYLAGMSRLRLIEILYLIGACSKEDWLAYMKYEAKYCINRKQGLIEIKAYEASTNRELNLQGVKLQAMIQIDRPSYEEVISFADTQGYVFDITKESKDFADEIKKTADLFELMKTNVHQISLPLEDGLRYSNWYDKTSYESTEFKVLQNIISLYNSLKIKDDETESFLNLMICLRLLNHSRTLFEKASKKSSDIVNSLRMKYAAEFFEGLIPTKIQYSDDERFVMLYFAIQKAKKLVLKYPDKEWQKHILDWISVGVEKFEQNIPENFKNLNPVLPNDVLNRSFFLLNNNNNNDLLNHNEDKVIQFELNEKLTHIDEVVEEINEKAFILDDEKQTKLEHYKKKLGELKPIYLLSELPDVYTFYALGIIDDKELKVLTRELNKKFTVKVIEKLDDFFAQFMSVVDRNVSDEILQGYQVYQKAKENHVLDEQALTGILKSIGMSHNQVDGFMLATKDLLTELLKEDFDKYLPLALKFKPAQFDLVYNFRTLSDFFITKDFNEVYFSLDEALPMTKCYKENNKDLTQITRLMLIDDIFEATEGEIPNAKKIDQARSISNNLLISYYAQTMQKLMETVDFEKYPNQAKRISTLVPYFTGLIDQKFGNLNIQQDILLKEKEAMLYLVGMAKYALAQFTNSKATRDYYQDWFDLVYGLSEKEKEEIKSLPEVPKYRRYASLIDSMSKEEQTLFLKEAFNYYYSQKDKINNNEDSRAVLGVCSDLDLLYAMGVLSPFEYDKVGETGVSLSDKNMKKEVSVFEVCEELEKDTPALKIPLSNDIISVMMQIRLAGSLVDYRYNYDDVTVVSEEYFAQPPAVTMVDLRKNSLKGEGLMIESLLTLCKILKEYNLESSSALKKILDSYWKESTQQLNSLAIQMKKKYPEMTKRILEQRGIFGLSDTEKTETISSRFRYYPKFFTQIRQAIEKEYKNTGKFLPVLNRFEKEIQPFVSFYKERAPILKTCLSFEKDR